MLCKGLGTVGKSVGRDGFHWLVLWAVIGLLAASVFDWSLLSHSLCVSIPLSQEGAGGLAHLCELDKGPIGVAE